MESRCTSRPTCVCQPQGLVCIASRYRRILTCLDCVVYRHLRIILGMYIFLRTALYIYICRYHIRMHTCLCNIAFGLTLVADVLYGQTGHSGRVDRQADLLQTGKPINCIFLATLRMEGAESVAITRKVSVRSSVSKLVSSCTFWLDGQRNDWIKTTGAMHAILACSPSHTYICYTYTL